MRFGILSWAKRSNKTGMKFGVLGMVGKDKRDNFNPLEDRGFIMSLWFGT
jgi:hypothetical protein